MHNACLCVLCAARCVLPNMTKRLEFPRFTEAPLCYAFFSSFPIYILSASLLLRATNLDIYQQAAQGRVPPVLTLQVHTAHFWVRLHSVKPILVTKQC